MTPIAAAGAGPSSAMASTSARNAPEMRWCLWRIASMSLPIASASSTRNSPIGSHASADETAIATATLTQRITTSPAIRACERSGMRRRLFTSQASSICEP